MPAPALVVAHYVTAAAALETAVGKWPYPGDVVPVGVLDQPV